MTSPQIDLQLIPQRRDLLNLLQRQGITDQRVLSALAGVPREAFVCDQLRSRAYENVALPLDLHQTISQPFIVGLMTQALDILPDHRVLEIGTGSGYQAAVLARLARDVYTVERHQRLSESAQQLLQSLGYRNIFFHTDDGTLGWPAHAPYDRIMVTATAQEVPQPLRQQLAPEGKLVMPVGTGEHQKLCSFGWNSQGQWTTEFLCHCRFVPLVGDHGHPEQN